MTPETFELEVDGVKYAIEGEMLPSGAAVFTFTPALPGRTPVIHVPQDVVEDVVRTMAVDVDFNHETGDVILTLPMVSKVEENEEEDQGYKTAMEAVPGPVVLEVLLDQVTLKCSHCGGFEFGEDILPENVDKLRKPFYLN